MPSTTVFKYRSLDAQAKPVVLRTRLAHWLVLAIALLCLAAAVKALASDDELAAVVQAFHAFSLKHFVTEHPMLLAAVPIYAIIWVLLRCAFSGQLYTLKHGTLSLTDEALSFKSTAPFGGNAVFRNQWHIQLKDIARLALRQPPSQQISAQLPALPVLEITLHDGTLLTLDPMLWYPTDCPSVALPWQSSVAPFWPRRGRGRRAHTENRAAISKVFGQLPLLQALARSGLVIPEIEFAEQALTQDMFAARSVKLALILGLSLFASALIYMAANSNDHLQNTFPFWLSAIVGAAAIAGMMALGRSDRNKAPTSHRVIAGSILLAGVLLGAEQMVRLVNGLGLEPEQAQRFAVHAGYLEPVDSQTAIGRIALPGVQSRAAWLREGTPITLRVGRGRLGLWHYDFAPLREAARAQGIR